MKKERTTNMEHYTKAVVNQIEFIMNNPKYKSEASRIRRVVEAWNAIWGSARDTSKSNTQKMTYDTINNMVTYKTGQYAGDANTLYLYIKNIIETITFLENNIDR